MDALIAEQAELQEKIDAANAWDLERTVEIAMDALRCPPGDADVATLSGGERRRVALCRLLLAEARPAAARRADQPSGRRIGRLAGALPAGLQGHGGGRHPRPLLPRQRRRLDPRARPRPRHPLARATTPPGSSRSRSAWPRRRSRRARRQRTLAARAGMDPPVARAPARPRARRASPAYEELLAESRRAARPSRPRSSSRPARGWATW